MKKYFDGSKIDYNKIYTFKIGKKETTMKTEKKYCIDLEEQVLNTSSYYDYKNPFVYETYASKYGDYETIICDTLEEVSKYVQDCMCDCYFDGNIHVYLGECEYNDTLNRWELVDYTDETIAYYISFHYLLCKKTAQFYSLKELQRSEKYDYRNSYYGLISGVFEYDSIDDYLKEEEDITKNNDEEEYNDRYEEIIDLLHDTELYDLYKKYGSNIPEYSEEYELF